MGDTSDKEIIKALNGRLLEISVLVDEALRLNELGENYLSELLEIKRVISEPVTTEPKGGNKGMDFKEQKVPLSELFQQDIYLRGKTNGMVFDIEFDEDTEMYHLTNDGDVVEEFPSDQMVTVWGSLCTIDQLRYSMYKAVPFIYSSLNSDPVKILLDKELKDASEDCILEARILSTFFQSLVQKGYTILSVYDGQDHNLIQANDVSQTLRHIYSVDTSSFLLETPKGNRAAFYVAIGNGDGDPIADHSGMDEDEEHSIFSVFAASVKAHSLTLYENNWTEYEV